MLKGSALYPRIGGTVDFFPWKNGTVVRIEADNLPEQTAPIGTMAPVGPFGFHIHEGSTCGVGANGNAYASAGGHYNPTNQPHPLHAGDLPPVFSNDGNAYMVVFTNRFTPRDVLGRTVILHQNPDDFRSQPAGDSGVRIACGVIEAVN